MTRQIVFIVIKILAFLVIVSIIIVAGLTYEAYQRFHGYGPLRQEISITIEKGTPLRHIAENLAESRVIFDPWSFLLGMRFNNWSAKAGEYSFTPLMSGETVAKILHEGKTLTYRLTIAEGMTSRQIVDILRATDILAGEITQIPPEGSLLPETWYFSRGGNRNEIIKRMQRSMIETVDSLWDNRAPNLPIKTKEEAVILASIVERETAVASERPLVASVFINRLNKRIRLQSDPTVVYGVSDGLGVLGRPIRQSDLDNPHPWNTYLIPALPPSAIANPGRESLQAVLNPAESNFLYFVADGTGGHAFARSLREHNNNVQQWRKIERDQR